MSESGQPRSMIAPAPRFPAPAPVAPAPPAARRGMGGIFFLGPPAIIAALSTSNPAITAAAVMSLGIIVGLLWKPGHPPVLLLVTGLQWLQASLMTLVADVRGVELRETSYARSIEEASYLSLAWVTALAIGAWLSVRSLSAEKVAATTEVPISMQRLLTIYGVWTIGLQVLGLLGAHSFAQVLQALSAMRWALCFAVFAYGWSNVAQRPIVIVVLAVEVGFGFMSFFSQFRVPLYLFTIALATVGFRPRLRTWFGLAIMFAITLYFGSLWSAIKSDYRDRLSGGDGTREQVVRIGVEERFDSFVELVGTVDSVALDEGFDKLLKRLAYVELFAYAIDFVPAVREHEEGALWGGAVAHVFVPRALFPDKPPLEQDTVIAERYTGLRLGAGGGTSISIGTAADSYVDFGAQGVIAIGFLYGLILGWGYRTFIIRRGGGVIAQGVAVALCVPFVTLELEAAKALGGFLSSLIVLLTVWIFLVPPLMRWLTSPTAIR
jgi:hypothetical protein